MRRKIISSCTAIQPAMNADKVGLPVNVCKRCGHEWVSRVENPRQCPKCKSYDWNEDKKNRRAKI
jgi:predicted Zn-ribbon and HTH transcriptional regulator